MNDTHPQAERVQIELLRQMTAARRAALASSLRNRTYWLARRGIERAYPALSEAAQKLKFVEATYGAELARRARTQWPGLMSGLTGSDG